MQLTAKLRNKTRTWNALLRPRVGDVVLNSGTYYSNITGYNDVLTNINVWFPIGNIIVSSPIITINRTAANIAGSDPFYVIDLTGLGMPAFPLSMSVYIDQAGTGDWVKQDPVDYNPVTHILSGMSSPTDFPAQLIKILAS